ncbi:MAG TPA: energy transducer TonB [Brevundimonas sp.]|jgi:TonB family protein|uniref:energy transducer TonB n=1 Tax=Brevundimonas sp. TaxID=1871086 RepID=UPI002E131332|nr:energy transducer TonB [Brevundimonas sp.]
MQRFWLLSLAMLAASGGLSARAQDAVEWRAAPFPGGSAVTADWGAGATLIARCREGRFDLVAGLPAQLEGARISASLGFDGDELTTRRWTATVDRSAIFDLLPETTARELVRRRTMQFVLDDGSPPRVRFELDLPVDPGPLAAVMRDCDVPIPNPEGRPEWVVNADWRVRPNQQRLNEVFPAAARDANIGGEAVLLCVIEITGLLTDCEVTRESPPGYGFGDAALVLSRDLRLTPRTIADKPVRSQATFPFVWRRPR